MTQRTVNSEGTSSKPATEVVNAMTSSADWLQKVETTMREGREIAVFTWNLEGVEQTRLTDLCSRHGYAAPKNLPSAEWEKYQIKMDLGDFAAKEQGMTPGTLYLLQPNPGRSTHQGNPEKI